MKSKKTFVTCGSFMIQIIFLDIKLLFHFLIHFYCSGVMLALHEHTRDTSAF